MLCILLLFWMTCSMPFLDLFLNVLQRHFGGRITIADSHGGEDLVLQTLRQLFASAFFYLTFDYVYVFGVHLDELHSSFQ